MTTTPYVLFIVRHCIIASLHHFITASLHHCIVLFVITEGWRRKNATLNTRVASWLTIWAWERPFRRLRWCSAMYQKARASILEVLSVRSWLRQYVSHTCVFFIMFFWYNYIRIIYTSGGRSIFIYKFCIYIMTISAHCVFALRSHHWWGSPPPPPLGEQLISDVSECCILLMCAEMRNLSTYDNVPLPFQQVSMLEQWQDEIKKHSRMDLSVRV